MIAVCSLLQYYHAKVEDVNNSVGHHEFAFRFR
jgi:hypothetical protein